jgi:hypothetical protein
MDGDEAAVLLSAVSSLAPFAPPDRVVRTLRRALIELLEPSVPPAIPATTGERPKPSRERSRRYASQPGLESWLPLRDRVLAELAARAMRRRELARQLGIALSTLKSVLLPRCRVPSKTNRAKFERWLERPPAVVAVAPPEGKSAEPKTNGIAALPAYKLSAAQREKLAGYSELDERAMRASRHGLSARVPPRWVCQRVPLGRSITDLLSRRQQDSACAGRQKDRSDHGARSWRAIARPPRAIARERARRRPESHA